MNRRQGRDRGGRSFGGDGLLGEGPGMGGSGMYEPMVNSQMNQLLLAQQLLQQQAALGGASGFGSGGDYGMGDMGGLGSVGGMHYLNQGMGGGYGGMGGGMHNDRKRMGGQNRDNDFKRRRRDSSGRSDRDRSRGRDSNRSGEGKDRNRSNRWDSGKDQDEGEKGEDDYDPAEPTEDDERKDKDGNLYCHVCNVSVYDDESFRRHLNGMKHTQRMNSLLTVHQMKSNQLNSRLRAEEHLRKIEGNNSGSSADPDYFCKICNNSLTIPWERHRFSNIHKQRQLQVKRGCGWCKVHDFNNFTEVLEHRETDEHKKNADLYGKKNNDSDRSRSRSRSHERRSDKHRSHRRSSSRDRSRREKEDEDEEDLTIPEFDPETPVGVKYIIPVTGFFCKLCHKFYNNEKSAKGSHCQTDTHYEKFKAATEEKVAAREKRLAEKAAAEAALKEKEEEEKKKNEAEKELGLEVGLEEDKEEAKDDTEVKAIPSKHEDDVDYDDDLPIEDVDNEGGLLKDDEPVTDDAAAASQDDTMGESYTTADNYSYLTENADDTTGTYQTYTEPEDKPVESYSTQDKSDLDTTAEENSMDVSAIGGEKEDETVVLSDEEVTSTPTSASKTSAKGRGGTARRGRGRGKARK